ncbi:Major facilitator, sugar transporter-like [Fusarium oxysporum f. sp. vasinfectum]|nr:Major facilitator, sugar transporter-like [Fusarium oxysporum f. sp. vasinfectum]KAK2923113.1 Major facilitator, sugar transporter-like [Fusarium oxysporum f. sp. vasinfectum]
MNSSWSWRLPSLLQGVPAILQLVLSIWVPGSLRWLVYKDRGDEALRVLSQYHSCGGHDSRLVRFELLEIEATLEEEKKHKAIQWTDIGVTNGDTQLLINAIAAVWQLCCSVFFAMLIGPVGRRGLITFRITTMLVVFIVWTTCSALNEDRHFSDRPLALVVVVMIFLFQVVYQPFAISTVPYVVECSLYSLRSKTAMIFQFCGYSASFFTGYVNPVTLDRIDWRYYIFACAVLGVEWVFAWWYLPETKDKGLEEIGQIFGGDELLTGTQAIAKKREEKYRGLMRAVFLSNMKLSLPVSCILAFTSSTLAGRCHNHAEGAHKLDCVSKSQFRRFGTEYCSNNWNKYKGDWTDFNDSSGRTGNVGKIGNFVTKQACEEAFEEVVNGCYDGWDGGDWAAHGVLLGLNFCKWDSPSSWGYL